jgi:hypothetical protein
MALTTEFHRTQFVDDHDATGLRPAEGRSTESETLG